jgi:hypothetical protein
MKDVLYIPQSIVIINAHIFMIRNNFCNFIVMDSKKIIQNFLLL